MTAAHCLWDQKYVEVSFGIKANGGCKSKMVIPESYLYIYPLYDSLAGDMYDIGNVSN